MQCRKLINEKLIKLMYTMLDHKHICNVKVARKAPKAGKQATGHCGTQHTGTCTASFRMHGDM